MFLNSASTGPAKNLTENSLPHRARLQISRPARFSRDLQLLPSKLPRQKLFSWITSSSAGRLCLPRVNLTVLSGTVQAKEIRSETVRKFLQNSTAQENTGRLELQSVTDGL